MKKPQTQKYHGLALAALLLGSASWAFATPNFYVNNFDVGGAASVAPGGITSSQLTSPCGVWYGDSILYWDSSQNSTLNADPDPSIIPGAGGGSCYVYADMTTANSMVDFLCAYPYDNLWYAGNPAGVDLSQYVAVHFDIKWDTVNSTISIDQFNNLSSLPSPPLQSWAGPFVGGLSAYCAGSDPNANGFDVQVAGNGGAFLANADIPDAAASGWVTVTIPINPALSGLNPASGIMLKKWINQNWGMAGGIAAYFWIDNIWFEGTPAPPPPPTIKSLTTSTPGLNLVFNTTGSYDRHEVALVSSNGLSWVGVATAGNPVTYSFTVSGFPKNPATPYSTAAYLMMSPNPAYLDNALDWNETNCIQLWLQQGVNQGYMTCSYKTNLPGAAIGTQVGSITYNNATGALGQWQLTFTSDTHGILTAPDNVTTSSFDLPPAVAAMFAENPAVGRPGFYLYLGAQPNTSAALNQAVCYSQFSVSGVALAQSDNFLTDQVLNTNTWMNGPGSGSPAANFVNPTNAAYWVTWTTPASGYSLQSATDLLGSWTTLTDTTPFAGAGAQIQLVTTNDVPVGTSASFFQLKEP
jgi:hypothetical protein